MSLPDSARAMIESGRLAHLVTLNRDGSPQVSCVWVGLDGDEIVSAHLMPDAAEATERPPRPAGLALDRRDRDPAPGPACSTSSSTVARD